jgi:hypothetical protein
MKARPRVGGTRRPEAPTAPSGAPESDAELVHAIEALRMQVSNQRRQQRAGAAGLVSMADSAASSAPAGLARAEVAVAPPLGGESDGDTESSAESWAGPVDAHALDERLAQLQEEAEQVRLQLLRVGGGSALQQTLYPPPATPGSLLEVQGRGAAARANASLRPLLIEYGELVSRMRKGSSLRMVLERGEEGSAHRSCMVQLRLDATGRWLCWTLDWEHHGAGSGAGAQRGGWDKTNTFRALVGDVAAIFCGGAREGELMGADPETMFRVHWAQSAALEPLQFAAHSARERQDWVVGLSLLHALLPLPE